MVLKSSKGKTSQIEVAIIEQAIHKKVVMKIPQTNAR